MEKITCQICGRPIKASKGVIAHHGYKRPGDGWQTASCMGARYLPYEIYCDRLLVVIKRIKNYLDDHQFDLRNLINNPPEKLTAIDFYTKKSVDIEKPADFGKDPKIDQLLSYQPRTYSYHYNNKKRDLERSIRWAKMDLDFMQKRLDAWKPADKTN